MAKDANPKDDEDDVAQPTFNPKGVSIGGETLVERILPHIKKIVLVFVLAGVAVSVVFFVRWRKFVKQEDNTALLVGVLDTSRLPVMAEPPPVAPDSTAPAPVTFKTTKDRSNAVLDAMAKSGASSTPLFKAGVQLDAGKVDDAIATYRSCENSVGLDGVLCREGLGIALEQKALAEKDAAAEKTGLETALAAFVAMQPEEGGLRRAHALYHQGRIQATLGKTAEAKALFEKAKPLAAAAEPPAGSNEVAQYQLGALIDRQLSAL